MVAMLAQLTTLADLMGGQDHLILVGDVLAQLRRLPTASVHCVVCSPPYLGLRDYGLPASVWGGDSACSHVWGTDGPLRSMRPRPDHSNGEILESRGQQGSASASGFSMSTGRFCTLCGAWRGCLGQEPTVELFIEHLVLIFDEVRRVLRPDGVLFVNLGDSYAGSGKGPTGHNGIGDQSQRQGFTGVGAKHQAGRAQGVIPTQAPRRTGRGIRSGKGYELHEPIAMPGLKPKDLMLVPERFAIAMQAAGWWVRSRVAWTKAAPMPESVRDRPVSAWEHVWILTPSERYFWDQEAIRAPLAAKTLTHRGGGGQGRAGAMDAAGKIASGHRNATSPVRASNPSGANLRNVWSLGPEPSTYDYCGPCDLLLIGSDRICAQVTVEVTTNGKTRWKLIGRVCPRCGGFAENWVQHFAGFPTALPRLCILAATSEHGACVECGATWRRVVDRTGQLPARERNAGGRADNLARPAQWDQRRNPTRTETVGWEPVCRCDTDEVEPCVVLDIFLGSGTTSVAARHLGRRSIGIELNPRYAALARHRALHDVPKWARPAKPVRLPRRPRTLPAPAQIPLLEVVS
jgi:DNA modification methylase